MDKGTQTTLNKVEDEEGDAPALVISIISIIKVVNKRGKAPCGYHRDASLLLAIRTQRPE
jgi:hypothetical protein